MAGHDKLTLAKAQAEGRHRSKNDDPRIEQRAGIKYQTSRRQHNADAQ